MLLTLLNLEWPKHDGVLAVLSAIGLNCNAPRLFVRRNVVVFHVNNITLRLNHKRIYRGSWIQYPVWQHTFVSPSAFSRRAVVSYWRKYVHEVLVNRLGGLSLPRKSVIRLTDHPDMTLDVYHGRKTTMQQKNIRQRLRPDFTS